MRQNSRFFVAGAALIAGGLMAVAAGDLTVFKAGEPIKSADVNANFGLLKSALEAPLTAERLADGAVTLPKLALGGAAADGKVLKLQNGVLAWAEDLLGTGGGAAYSAGTGLALSGTTFSLANGGITKDKISATGEADGKVLKIQNGSLAWANDLVGGSGSSYNADGNSLALGGTTFSVRDGGIGESKIAVGAVTGGKLKLPLSLSGKSQSGQPAELSVVNEGNSVAVQGTSTSGYGVYGLSASGRGVSGYSTTGVGVYASSSSGRGVYGYSNSAPGVEGASRSGPGVSGTSDNADGVRGVSSGSFSGVYGQSASGPGVQGASGNAPALIGSNNGSAETLQLIQAGNGALIDARGVNGATAFSVDRFGNVFSRSNSYTSDRNAKTNFQQVDAGKVLEKIAALPVSRWSYKQDDKAIQHLGPMAQDFHAAFGLNGSDDKHINAVDIQGVALAAIQGLNQKLESEAARRSVLESENGALKRRLETLEAQVAQIKAAHGN